MDIHRSYYARKHAPSHAQAVVPIQKSLMSKSFESPGSSALPTKTPHADRVHPHAFNVTMIHNVYRPPRKIRLAKLRNKSLQQTTNKPTDCKRCFSSDLLFQLICFSQPSTESAFRPDLHPLRCDNHHRRVYQAIQRRQRCEVDINQAIHTKGKEQGRY